MATIRKREGRAKPWQVRYRDPDGVQRSRAFTLKRQADDFRATVEVDLRRGDYIDPDAGRVTVQEFAEAWLGNQTFDVTTRIAVQSRLTTHVYPHLGDVEIRQLKPSTVQAWIRGRSRDLAPSYVGLILGHLKAILNAAVDDGLISKNPAATRSVRAPKVERRKVVPWTVEQVQTITRQHPEPFRALPMVAAGTGLRQGELFGIALEDIDFLRRTLHVRQQVRLINGKPVFAPPKGSKVREVPLPDAVSIALAVHLRVHPAIEVTLPWLDLDGEPTTRTLVFTGPKGAALNKNAHNERVWKPALRAAGIDPSRQTGMHQLRHHYASVLLDAGVSIAALADYLGHGSPSVTLNVYSHMMPHTEDRARSAIDSAHADVAQMWTGEAQDGR